MAQTQLIRRRIKSIGNTRQITKAMEVVSSVKMRKSQDQARLTRPYATEALVILQSLTAISNPEIDALFQSRPIKTQTLIVITSDRGLAGAYNSNIMKQLVETLSLWRKNGQKTKLIVMGQKGVQFIRRLTGVEIIGVYTGLPIYPHLTDIRPIAKTVIEDFRHQQTDEVAILSTRFVSTIKQTVAIQKILPITVPQTETATPPTDDTTRYEPSPERILEQIGPKFIETQLYQAYLEAVAAEQSMRMLVMKNATDNATEIIDALTLTYNSVRQASITQELAEISSGAEAMERNE